MRVAFVTERIYREDRLFDPRSRNDAFREIPRRFEALGHEAHTADIYEQRGESPDLLVYVDSRIARRWRPPAAWRTAPRWLVIVEAEVTLAENGRRRHTAQFDRIFTWRSSQVDNATTFELRLPYPFETATPLDGPPPDRFCTLIAANKRFRHRLALYPQRREAIRWFERHHPDEFDLYGHDWDLLVVGGPRLVRALNVALPRGVRRRLAPSYPSWRGPIGDKLDVLRRYRFSICFENAQELDGYLTEKLFDCFRAGSVPVYWGAPDIAELVPGGYVDFRDFGSYEALYDHLHSLDDEDYAALREAGRAFAQSDRAIEVFGFGSWVDTLAAHVDRQSRGEAPPQPSPSTSA